MAQDTNREIRIYFEGHKGLKDGFRTFFTTAVPSIKRLRLIEAGATPIEDFIDGVQANPDALCLLLMDSDVLKKEPYTESVKTRKEWQKREPEGIADDQLHFMVRKMEAWFVADSERLCEYFKLSKLPASFPDRKNVEELTSKDVDNAIREVARLSKRKHYVKGGKEADDCKILKSIRPSIVAQDVVARHCARLIETLRNQETNNK